MRPVDGNARFEKMAKELSLAPSFVASALIHLVVLALASTVIGQRSHPNERNSISVALLEPAQEEKTILSAGEERKRDGGKAAPTSLRPKTVHADAPPPSTPPKETVKANEKTVPPPDYVPTESAAGETGGSTPGADTGVTSGSELAPDAGNSGNGNGSAIAGLGRGFGSPGLPASVPALRTNREAKPLQTARASYPPMALRLGLESDVMLRIAVDADGKVTKAEIIKSGGAGFDEEALKAVKQSRFEPAQRDGQYVAAEFSYIYRFRLQR
jgi:periplasmic protein TonB